MLVGIKGMLRYRDILQGTKFTWLTDHKGLIHLYNQKNLSGRQAQWIEKICKFDFNIEYVPRVVNVLPDALSCIYSNNAPGIVCAPSEYVHMAEDKVGSYLTEILLMLVLVGSEAMASSEAGPSRT